MKTSVLQAFLWHLVVIGSQGLRFTLDRDIPLMQRARPYCAVLRCQEESTTSGNITSMNIARSPRASTWNRQNHNDILVASLSSQQPSITRVANGVRVEGLLDTDTSTLRLELYKQGDLWKTVRWIKCLH
ncbi:hypothetical protein ElyMa_006088400 [Elysia marginata]|uniref:Secreted protein n=1 Tax=Elysia marginata TaxID=1093978 RepID=A0AAV4GPZ8_9GAST|nr:hypothetical protein ElyMa_006088400 [Elysia marginata]